MEEVQNQLLLKERFVNYSKRYRQFYVISLSIKSFILLIGFNQKTNLALCAYLYIHRMLRIHSIRTIMN